jgi:hypothetical protein
MFLNFSGKDTKMFLQVHTSNDCTIEENSRDRNNLNVYIDIDTITPSGEKDMSLIITRLSELSDALQNVSLYPEARVVQSHINRLNSDEYSELISNQGLDAVLTELVNDFDSE